MALPVTENFSNPPSNPLTDRIGWSQFGALLAAGKATSGTYQDETDFDDKAAYWDADTFTNDQYSQIELAAVTTATDRLGVILRAGSGNEALLIRFKANDGDFEAYRWDSSGTRIALPGNPYTPSATFNVGDIMRAEIVGTTLTLKIDYGSGFVTETTWDASSGPSSGSAGVYIAASGTSVTEGDNWEGGNVAAAGTEISAGVDALTLTDNNVIVNAETSFTTTLEPLTLTSYPATVNAETEIAATLEGLLLTEYAASIKADTAIAAAIEGLSLTSYNAAVSLGVNINPAVDALTLNDFNASINAETNIAAGVDSLSLTAFNASVALSGGGFQPAWAINRSAMLGQGLR